MHDCLVVTRQAPPDDLVHDRADRRTGVGERVLYSWRHLLELGSLNEAARGKLSQLAAEDARRDGFSLAGQDERALDFSVTLRAFR